MAAAGKGAVKLRVPAEVLDLIRGAHPQIKRKLRSALEIIQSDPDAGKALKEQPQGLRSFRVGRLRIIYRTARTGIIEIVAIGPRRSIYEETLRLVKREARRRT